MAGHLYGLGRADAKLGWLAKAAAIERLHGQAFIRPLVFTGNLWRRTWAPLPSYAAQGAQEETSMPQMNGSPSPSLNAASISTLGLIATFCLNDSLPYT